MLGNGRMFISHHHPGEVSASFVISPYIWILWSTALWAAYIRHRVMGEHDHVVTDSKPSINTSQACQLDQTDSLSARVNQILVGASREHRALHSTWSWLLKFTLWWGWSWSKGFVWVQEAEPLQKSVCCSQDAIYCNRSCFKTWKSVTFSWDQERALLIFFACVKQQYNFEPPLLSHQFKSQCFAKMTILCKMKSPETNWYKEGCVLLTKAFSSLSCLGAYSWKPLNLGGWITFVTFTHNLFQHYLGVRSKQTLLIRDNEHNSLVVLFHFTNYITGSHP